MTKDGRWKVSFNLAAPLYRVRSGKSQRLRYTALNGTSSSARSRQPPEPESSIRVPGRLPVTRMHRDSSRCLARALAPPVCDTWRPPYPSTVRPTARRIGSVPVAASILYTEAFGSVRVASGPQRVDTAAQHPHRTGPGPSRSLQAQAGQGLSDGFDVITVNRHVCFNRIILFHGYRMFDADADVNETADALTRTINVSKERRSRILIRFL